MTQKISSVNIEASTLSSFTGPLISTVSIANSSYVIVDDTAVSNAGGYAVINGNNFVSGAQVLFGNTSATSVTYVNTSTLNVQVPALAAGSYVMYVQNPDGSTAIRLNGITSSPIPVWGTDSTLTQQDAGVAFSISLAASSDSNVTFALSSGSTLPPGTTLTSNGVFSGTVTIEEETTYNFSVDAIDAENQDTLRSFSVTVVTGDVNYKNTVLHLSGGTTNNTWITDISSNTAAITVNGDARPAAFSPYETVWSNFFDGTVDNLTIDDNAAFEMDGDFTVEAWFYATSVPNALQSIITKAAAGVFSPYSIYVTNGLNVVLYSSTNGSSWNLASGTSFGSVSLNQWNHVALSRSGTNVRLFLNGSLSTTITNGNPLTNNGREVTIGGRDDATELFFGYISNVRIVKGTAVYTDSFTPSNSPLTAIPNTSLLTCQSSRFVDNSTNNFFISRSGDVSVSNFGPFVETDVTTGSGYFDGTTDYLVVPNNPGIQFGTEEFTIEFWMYRPTATNVNGSIVNMTGGVGDWGLIMTGGVMYFQSRYASASLNNNFSLFLSSSTQPSSVFNWVHIAYVRVAGGSSRFYLNGVGVGSPVTDTTNYNGTGSLQIGGVASGGYGSFLGYLSNLRIVKGVALYTGNFTPPNQPLTIAGSSAIYANTSNVNTSYSSSNTSLLTLQSRIGENNNRFVDTSGINNLITRNGNATQGTFSPFSVMNWSNYFDGTGDYLTIPNIASNTSLTMGTGDFTIEFWFYLPSLPGTEYEILDTRPVGLNGAYPLVYFIAGTLRWYINNGDRITSSTLTTGIWYHAAICRSVTSTRMFINGIQSGSTYTDSNNYLISTFTLGATNSGSFPLNGYLSNFRILKGTALYTSNFTPPTSPLTAISNTSLLTCQSNRFVDNSTNNFAITRNGDVSVQPFSPFKPTNSWSPTTVGGSMLFDGTGDFLTVPNNAVLNPETQNFVMEAWVYIRALTGANQGFNGKGTAGTDGYSFFITNALVLSFIWNGTGGATITAGTLKLNAWHHVAVVRNDGVIRLYLDGVGAGSSTVCTTNITTTGVKYVGQARGTNPVNGYMSGYRMIKGELPTGYDATASTITVPTAPFGSLKSTSLLLNGTNGGIIDYTGKNNLETVGDAKTRNNLRKYGNTSLFFDGTGDYLLAPSDPSFDFGTGDFTIEMWVNFTNATSTWQAIISRAYGVAGGWRLYKHQNDNQLRWYHNTTSILLTTGSDIASGVWSHIAVVRNGTTLTIYINGTNRGSVTNTTSYNPGNYAVEIGSGVVTSTFPMTGYIEDLRIIKGVAIYTANFTPPISSFKTK